MNHILDKKYWQQNKWIKGLKTLIQNVLSMNISVGSACICSRCFTHYFYLKTMTPEPKTYYQTTQVIAPTFWVLRWLPLCLDLRRALKRGKHPFINGSSWNGESECARSFFKEYDIYEKEILHNCSVQITCSVTFLCKNNYYLNFNTPRITIRFSLIEMQNFLHFIIFKFCMILL